MNIQIQNRVGIAQSVCRAFAYGMPGCKYVEEIGSATMLATKRSAGVGPVVNLRELICTPLPSANEAAHISFETRKRRPQKSITGVSVVPQKGLMSSNFFKKIPKLWVLRIFLKNFQIQAFQTDVPRILKRIR